MGGLLEEARVGAGQVVVVEGEAGVGKSRLLDEAVNMAERLGFEVLRGVADELERDRPFGVISDAVGVHPGAADEERAGIARLALAEAGEGDGAGGVAGGSGPPDLSFEIVESVVALVERLAAAGPVFLVLDDFHWADPSTTRTVRALLRVLPQLPLALVLALRPFPRDRDVERVVEDVSALGGHRLALGGLNAADVERLTQALLGARPGPSLLRHISGAAGNPLFVIELARGVEDEGALRRAGDEAEMEAEELPSSLRRAILRRVSYLPPAAVEVLRVATVLGRRFPLTLLAAVMNRSPAELAGPLEDGLDAGLLDQAEGDFVFRHDLIRDAIYEEVPQAIRHGLHRETARVLSSFGAPLPQVAEHFLLGARGYDADAVEWLSRAARQAASRAPVTAVKLYHRAAALAPPDSPEAHALVAELAPLLIQTGQPEAAAAVTRDVLAAGPAPEVEVSLRRAMGEVLWTQGWLEPAIDELEGAAAVDGAPALDRRGASALAAYLKLFVGDPDAAATQAQRIRTDADAAGDDFAVCLCEQTLALTAEAEARLPEAMARATAAVSTAQRSQDPRVGHLHPHLTLGFVLLDADRLGDAEAALQEGRRRAERRGTVLWLPLYQGALAMQRAVAGEWDDAQAEAEVGLRLCDEVGTRLFASFLHGLTAWVEYQRGRLDAAEAGLDAAVREFIAAASPSWHAKAGEGVRDAGAHWPLEWGLWLQALLEEGRGNSEAALVALQDAWAVARPLRYFLGYRMFAPDLVRVAVAAGDRSAAASVIAEVEEGAARSGTASARGAVLRCRGLLDDDADCFLGAAGIYRTTPCRSELAFTLEEAGAALGRAGRTAESVAALEEALDFYTDAGASRAAGRTDAVLRSLGVRRRRPGPPGRPSVGWDSLTPTELSVVGLAAEGLTNRQIGERLFVSRRTVETHLAHVFSKLSITSRAQLAAEAARRSTP